MQHGLIPDEWVVAYASGNLSEAQATIVATHAAYHPALRARIADAEALGGVLLEESDKVSVSDKMLDDIFAHIDSVAKDDPDTIASSPEIEPVPGTTTWPKPLQQYVGEKSKKLKWRYMGPGMRRMKLWTGENGECLWLFKAKGGIQMPEHDHTGQEMTLVLEGSYHVGDSQFKPGDIEIAADDIEDHRVMIDEGQDCICLVVTESPVKLKSLIGRALQPIFGV